MIPAQKTGDPLVKALLDAPRHRPQPTMDVREGGHHQSIASAAIRGHQGGRLPKGAVHIIVAKAHSRIRGVPVGMTAHHGTTALSAPLVTFDLFLGVYPHPHPSAPLPIRAPIQTANQTRLPKASLNQREWAPAIVCLKRRGGSLSTLTKVPPCLRLPVPRHLPRTSRRSRPLR